MRYAAAELESDREVVLEAVRQCGDALQFASEELRCDREVVAEAVRRGRCFGHSPLQYADAELRRDRELVLEVVQRQGAGLRFADEELRCDREVVLEAVRRDGCAVRYAAVKLQRDREVMLEAVRQDGCTLKYAATEFQRDREMVLEAVRQNDKALDYASEDLRADPVLSPSQAQSNAIAGSGARAPVYVVTEAVAGPGRIIEVVVAAGFCGEEFKTLQLPEDATLGDLAHRLVQQEKSSVVHMVMPGKLDAIGPLDVGRPIVAWTHNVDQTQKDLDAFCTLS